VTSVHLACRKAVVLALLEAYASTGTGLRFKELARRAGWADDDVSEQLAFLVKRYNVVEVPAGKHGGGRAYVMHSIAGLENLGLEVDA
jgi:hypothetical protein